MIYFVNPRSAESKPRLPLSLLALARMFPGERVTIIDGNLQKDTATALMRAIASGDKVELVAFTVMPGPQVRAAINVSRQLKAAYPHILILWGGYFPHFQASVVVKSPLVDFVIRGAGEHALPALLQALERNTDLGEIPGLVWEDGETVHANPVALPVDPNELPLYAWELVPLKRYLGRTFLGDRTINYHSSFGCPFPCTFCAVNALYQRKYVAETPARIEKSLNSLLSLSGANAVEFHDNNFFVNAEHTIEVCERLQRFSLQGWWAEGRIDTLMNYEERVWQAMKKSGLKMIFSGAESGLGSHLRELGKASLTAELITAFALKCKSYDIIPEFSFMLGANQNVEEEFRVTEKLIRNLKKLNPRSIIVLYIYSPVFDTTQAGRTIHRNFFPDTLEQWEKPPWDTFDQRRGSRAPWLSRRFIRKVHDFETVLNGRFPAETDIHLSDGIRKLLPRISSWRYRWGIYAYPLEIRFLQRLARYARPEEEGL